MEHGVAEKHWLLLIRMAQVRLGQDEPEEEEHVQQRLVQYLLQMQLVRQRQARSTAAKHLTLELQQELDSKILIDEPMIEDFAVAAAVVEVLLQEETMPVEQHCTLQRSAAEECVDMAGVEEVRPERLKKEHLPVAADFAAEPHSSLELIAEQCSGRDEAEQEAEAEAVGLAQQNFAAVVDIAAEQQARAVANTPVFVLALEKPGPAPVELQMLVAAAAAAVGP